MILKFVDEEAPATIQPKTLYVPKPEIQVILVFSLFLLISFRLSPSLYQNIRVYYFPVSLYIYQNDVFFMSPAV